MSGLAHFFERDGVPTTLISLVREHAERMRPPRALHVPFELGRPLGAPDDPGFQSRVLRSVLTLLDRTERGPILEDFRESPPGPPPNLEGWTCPINLAPPVEDMSDHENLRLSLTEEIGRLQTWFDRSLATLGRNTFGVSGLDAADIGGFMVDLLADPNLKCPDPGMAIGDYAKLVTDDLRNFYLQAANARPGQATEREINDWLWGQTVFARTIGELNRLCEASADPSLRRLSELNMVPHTQRYRFA